MCFYPDYSSQVVQSTVLKSAYAFAFNKNTEVCYMCTLTSVFACSFFMEQAMKNLCVGICWQFYGAYSKVVKEG